MISGKTFVGHGGGVVGWFIGATAVEQHGPPSLSQNGRNPDEIRMITYASVTVLIKNCKNSRVLLLEVGRRKFCFGVRLL